MVTILGNLGPCDEDSAHREKHQFTNHRMCFPKQGKSAAAVHNDKFKFSSKHVKFSQDGSRIVSSDKFGRIYFWRLPQHLNTATIQEKNMFQNIPYNSQ